MRVAVYYAPAVDDPLWAAGCSWLGRDAETGGAAGLADAQGFGAFTAEPRRYGFHATLKPPMRLATAYDLFMADLVRLATGLHAFELPPLRVANLSGFLALRETRGSAALQALADACVTGLDPHRAPLDVAELARRRQGGLSAAQDAMLVQWGYPHVLESWFFHMTLTRRLTEAERAVVCPAAQAHFADALARPRRVEALTVFTQASLSAPFLVAERVPLGR